MNVIPPDHYVGPAKAKASKPSSPLRSSRTNHIWRPIRNLLLLTAVWFIASSMCAQAQYFPPAIQVQGNGNNVIVPFDNTVSPYNEYPGNYPGGFYADVEGTPPTYTGYDIYGTEWSVSFGWSYLTQQWYYTVTSGDPLDSEEMDSGVYDPDALTFTGQGSITETPIDIDGTSWPSTYGGGPLAIFFNGDYWHHVGGALNINGDAVDAYSDGGDTYLFLDLTAGYFIYTGGSLGYYSNGVFWTGATGDDIRPAASNNFTGFDTIMQLTSIARPAYPPTFGPPALWINNDFWYFAGTVTSDEFGDEPLPFDLYVNWVGQNLVLSDTTFTITDAMDGYNFTGGFNGVFLDSRIGIASYDGYGSGTPLCGVPMFWSVGNPDPWYFCATGNGADYYQDSISGCTLEIQGTYAAYTYGTGTYINGAFSDELSQYFLNPTTSPTLTTPTLTVNDQTYAFSYGGSNGMTAVDVFASTTTAQPLYVMSSNMLTGTVSLGTPTSSSVATYSYGGFSSSSGVNITPAAPALGPPALMVNGVMCNHLNSVSTFGQAYQDNYLGNSADGPIGVSISGSSVQPSSSSTGYTVYLNNSFSYAAISWNSGVQGTYYPGGAFYVADPTSSNSYQNPYDVRLVNTDGSFYTVPGVTPIYGGPAAYWADGDIWVFQGTANGAPGDLYVGSLWGQTLWNNNGALSLIDELSNLSLVPPIVASGTNSTSPIVLSNNSSVVTAAIPTASVTLNTSPITGPNSLTITGPDSSTYTSSFTPSPDGYDIYAGGYVGQYVILSNSNNPNGAGTVLVVDEALGISATGTYSSGVFSVDGFTIVGSN